MYFFSLGGCSPCPPLPPPHGAKPTLKARFEAEKVNVSKSPKCSHYYSSCFFFRSLVLLLFCLQFQSFLNIFTSVYVTCRSFCRAISQSFPAWHSWVLILKLETQYVKNCIFLLLLYNSVVMSSVGASPDSDSDSRVLGLGLGSLDSDSDSHHVDSDSDSHPLDSDSRAESYRVRWNFVTFSTTTLWYGGKNELNREHWPIWTGGGTHIWKWHTSATEPLIWWH